MRQATLIIVSAALFTLGRADFAWAQFAFRDQQPGTWVKLSPLETTPPSPRLGYEGACVWDGWRRVMIRYGGHNKGGGGEQGSELWTFDPLTAKWRLYEPNTSPPGICCGQQNVFDPVHERYLRFPAFSGSHGWQWFREIYLNNSSLWSYDLETNTWRNLRPLPAPRVRPLRCASWDIDHQVVVLFGGEGSQRYNKATIRRLSPHPLTGRTYIDGEASKRTRRYYVVAVDALGQEGFPSSPVWFQREWRRFYEPFVSDWHQ